MIASGRIAYLVRRAGDYGVKAQLVGIDMTKVRQRKRDIVDSFRGCGCYRSRRSTTTPNAGKSSIRHSE